MTGTDETPIQIDESYFRGQRNYGRELILEGDIVPQGEDRAREHEERASPSPSYSDESQITRDIGTGCSFRGRQNHWKRMVGPWVVGFYKSLGEV